MKFRKGYKYQLAETEIVQTPLLGYDIDIHLIRLTTDGLLTTQADFAWDGASGPTLDTDDTYTPSLVHDVFAKLIRLKLLPRSCVKTINKFLNKMLKDRGMNWFRRRYWMIGLWLTGGSFADPENVKKVYTVM